MTRKVFLVFALVCAAVQGAWAWDGNGTPDSPYQIKTSADWQQLANNVSGGNSYSGTFFEMTANIDEGIRVGSESRPFSGTLNGLGHTIRINISGATDNYQGLFAIINEGGKVQNLRVSGNIHCSSSRLVGGIAGENYGTIENCWVSADVSSDWHESVSIYDAKVGGITGENSGTVQFCCVTGNVTNDDADVGAIVGCNNSSGTVSHVTFYGTRYTNHDQDNLWVGDSDGTLNNQHSDDLLTDEELTTYLSRFSGYELYREAVQHPYAINLLDEDQNPSAIAPSATGSRSGQTITLSVHPIQGISLRGVTVKDAEGNDISTTGNTDDGYTFTMPKRDVNVKVSYIFGGGNGTKSAPYLIKTTEHWNQLASDVANAVPSANVYNNKYFRLENDISVTTMVGTPQNRFAGSFDGNGHKLTVDYTTNEEAAAPFRYAICPEISNLHVAGTITTSEKLAAGLIACSSGYADLNYDTYGIRYISRFIKNCRSSVTINSSVNGDGTHGGLVGRNDQCELNIEGCIFDGKMLGSSTNSCAGFVGYNDSSNGGLVNVSQSLFAPENKEWSFKHTFVGGSGTIRIYNCYCFENFGNQSVLIYPITADENVAMVNDCDAPKTYSVSGTEFYDTGLKYNGVHYAKSGDAVNLKLTHPGTLAEGKAVGNYTVSAGTLTARDTYDGYVLTMPAGAVNISAQYVDASMVQWSGEGTGEALTPYIIDTPARWNEFAEKVNAGLGNDKYGIAYYKLDADITVNTMVGTSEHRFRGHFDGDGKTLTLSYGTAGEPVSEDYCAPFRYVDGADIHDVIAEGSIYTANQFAAGLVGYSVGNTSIADSRVSVTINSSVVGNGSHGGIAANIQGGKVTITGCAFNGQMLGPNTTSCGGLVGWTEVKVNFRNCLFAPASLTVSTDGSATFARNYSNYYNSDNNLANYGCRYTTTLGDTQYARLVYAARLADTPCKEYDIAGVKYYVAETIVSNVAVAKILPNGATIRWTSTAEEYNYQVRYRKNKTKYFNSFEDDIEEEGWTTIDADNDHFNWRKSYDSSPKTGNYSLVSENFLDVPMSEEKVALTPDNWLVSPQLSLGGQLSVWLRGLGEKYEEHFAIYLSTTGQFVDDDGKPLAGVVILVPETVTSNQYTEYTADLSNYNGQQGYIAIRHFNCTGQNMLILDDFSIYDTSVDNTWTVVDADISGATITGLVPLTTYDYEVVYTVDDATYYTPTASLTTLIDRIILADDANNSSVLEEFKGITMNVTLAGRTLWKDGSWNTLCLPFDVELAGSPLEGATVKTLESSAYDSKTGTLTLNFTTDDLTSLSAGKPYIVKWDKPESYTAYDGNNASECSDIVAPTFSGVIIDYNEDGYVPQTYVNTDYVNFIGTFSPISLIESYKDVLYLGADNKLYYPSAEVTIGSCRAIFNLKNDIVTGDNAQQARAFVLNFGDGETTEISNTNVTNHANETGAWYDLQGRSLDGKPSRAGVYINNGKKVVIK